MTRTTPPRPVDIEEVFPALAAHRATATRLHPRPGTPAAEDASVGGPLLWPAGEPWPVCTAPHSRTSGHLLSDVRLRRRVERASRGRELTEQERRTLDAMTAGRHDLDLPDDAPLPLLAVAQLRADAIPDLRGPDGCDLLQVFWCPFEAHGPDHTVDVVLRWRRAAEVGSVLTPQPEPPVVGRAECVPNACVLHPEQVVEHQYLELLDPGLRDEIADWEETLLDEGDDDAADSAAPASYATYEEYEAAMAAARAEEPEEIDYRSDLSLAPGWKVGGFASWHLTGPAPVDCPTCGTPMPPLLTVDKWEADGASRSWVPLEDRAAADDPEVIDPVGVYLGRGQLRVHTCPADPSHPHRLTFQ
ncbi:hypothetical protein [Streptomyces sp. ODS05-4]|uniref:hypothetical protein n=1 Tax=Streptomyces sp. ODS05-4 TaxID=2944939 RepID=UPI00210878EC|nr:hypothetical protein [Streptomyces sp. ODS05-4]